MHGFRLGGLVSMCVLACGPSPGASESTSAGSGSGSSEDGDDDGDGDADTSVTSIASTDDGASTSAGADDTSTGMDETPAPLLFAGGRATCIATPELVCFGDNAAGQLGLGDDPIVEVPTALPFIPTSLALSFMAGCLVEDGRVHCAGENGNGLLVAGAEAKLHMHVPVAIDDDVVAVTTGFAHRCALRADATVVCWGDNTSGALGSDVASTGVPTVVPGLVDVVSVSGGNGHTCAALGDGSAWCWGDDLFGASGNPEREFPFTPVAGLVDVVSVHVDGYSSCALHGDGHVSCWGRDTEGQLGVPPESVETCLVVVEHPCARTPVTLSGITTARAMDFGSGGGCALTDEGVMCWGGFASASGSEGVGPSLVDVPGDALAVDVSSEHACIRTTEGVFCWGRATEGQLGSEVQENTDVPVQVW